MTPNFDSSYFRVVKLWCVCVCVCVCVYCLVSKLCLTLLQPHGL